VNILNRGKIKFHYNSTKKNKLLRNILFVKEAKDLYTEIYKTLLKEMKENPMFMD
jgi:hypothetical protein